MSWNRYGCSIHFDIFSRVFLAIFFTFSTVLKKSNEQRAMSLSSNVMHSETNGFRIFQICFLLVVLLAENFFRFLRLFWVCSIFIFSRNFHKNDQMRMYFYQNFSLTVGFWNCISQFPELSRFGCQNVPSKNQISIVSKFLPICRFLKLTNRICQFRCFIEIVSCVHDFMIEFGFSFLSFSRLFFMVSKH